MPTEMRRGALRSAFAAKIADGEVIVVEQLGVAEPRTKALTTRLKGLGIEGMPTLVVVAERSATLERAARNLAWIEVETAGHASAYQVIKHARVVVERAALLALQEALGT
jgi:large subunit ribosomal protein L4